MVEPITQEFRTHIIIGAIVGIILLSGYLSGFGPARGQSQYTGVVADAEIDRGILFRTSQARVKTSPQSSTFEEFCIPESLESKFRELASNQKRVTITYSRPLFVPVWKCQTPLSIVQSVKPEAGN